MMNKKGLSTIVATSMVILITVVLVGMLILYLIPFVKNNLSKGSECLDYDDYFTFEDSLGFNCYSLQDEKSIYYSVRAKNDAGAGNKIAGYDLELFGAGISQTIEVREGSEINVLSMYGGDRALSIPGAGSTLTYKHHQDVSTGHKTYSYLNIYPALKSGRVCGKRSDRLNLITCESLKRNVLGSGAAG